MLLMDPLPLALLPPGLLLRPACLPACLQSGCRQSTRAGGRPSCATTAGRPGRRHSTLFTTAAVAAAPTTPASSEPRPLSHLLSVHVGFLAFSLIPCTCCSTLPRPTSGGGCGGRRALAGPATAHRSTGLHCKTAFVASCGGRIAPPTACKGPFLGRGAVPGCPLRRRRNRRKRSCLGPRAPQFSLCLRALSVLDSRAGLEAPAATRWQSSIRGFASTPLSLSGQGGPAVRLRGAGWPCRLAGRSKWPGSSASCAGKPRGGADPRRWRSAAGFELRRGLQTPPCRCPASGAPGMAR